MSVSGVHGIRRSGTHVDVEQSSEASQRFSLDALLTGTLAEHFAEPFEASTFLDKLLRPGDLRSRQAHPEGDEVFAEVVLG